MENTKNPEAELDNKAVSPDVTSDKDESVTLSKSDWEKVQQTIAKHERLLKKSEGQTVDKEIVNTIQEVAFNQKVNKLSSEANISPELAEQIYKFKSDFTKADLENPFIKNLIDSNKRKSRVAGNTPGTSFGSSDLPKDFSKLTRDEKIQNFRKVMGTR